MKTPQELQSIFNKFPKEKIELKAERVELNEMQKAKSLQKKMSNIDADLKKASKELKAFETPLEQLKELEKIQKQALAKIKTVGDIMERYGRSKDEYNQVYDNVKKAADNLGVKISDIPEMKELDKTFDDLADTYRPFQQLHSSVARLSGYF